MARVPAELKTVVTELPESRVRVEVEVPSGEVEQRLERKARQLGGQLKLPGFRRGKVPAPLVLQRVGREAVLEEAVREQLGSWYADAIERAGIVPVGDPKLDLGELPAQGQALEFSIEIGVLPKAELGAYRGLEVGRAEPEVADEQVDEEIERLRERLARLETVEREAGAGDFVVVDYEGALSEDGGDDPPAVPASDLSGRDQLVELASGRLIPGFEEGLVGARAGEVRTVQTTFPEDYGEQRLAGRQASFEVTVKEVKQKRLPEVGEDFAVDVGFDTVDELRQDITGRLLEAQERQVAADFRQAALDAAAAQAAVEVPKQLAQARAQEMWERMLHSLSHRGISREAYLAIDGRPEEQILAELEPDAERALRREAVITAVVEAEGIEPSEEDVLEALRVPAEDEGVAPEKVLEDLRRAGRLDEVREELAARQAIDLIAEHSTPIPLERARAREKLWTPEGEAAAKGKQAPEAAGGKAGGELWTPGR